MSYRLTIGDIENVLGDKVYVMDYNDVTNTQSNKLFQKSNRLIILLGDGYIKGHYVTLIKNKSKKQIYYYDSFGHKLKKTYKRLYKIVYGFASHYKYDVLINTEKMQEYKEGINTCGRHAIIRIKYCNLNNEEFNKFIKSLCCEHMNPDKIVTLMTRCLPVLHH
jgi:hypothetical protein